MKKLFILIALMAALPTLAQEGRWHVEAGVGFSYFERFMGRTEIIGKETVNTEINGATMISPKYKPIVLPTFCITGGYDIPNTPLGFFFNIYWNYAWTNLYGGPAPLHESEHLVHAMPEMRIYYMRKKIVKLYASLGAGVRYRRYSETLDGDTVGNGDFRFTWEVSPISVSLWDNWHVNIDFGFGTAYSILKFGVGYSW